MGYKEIPGGLQVAPSLLSADFSRLVDEFAAVEAGGVEILHLDVMDGHFVPNITFGPPLVRAIRKATGLFLDTHLMISDPGMYARSFAEAGADLLTVHLESLQSFTPGGPPSDAALDELRTLIDEIRAVGCGSGITFRPGTAPEPWLTAVGELVDLILVMTVEPGFGGQAFMETMVPRIAWIRDQGWRARIEVDGGISPETAGICTRAGAEILVAGNAVFGAADRCGAIAAIVRAGRAPSSQSAG